ncbi:BTAD domain-containing putative transcriptional regulator [Salinispora oceanensis]
MRIDLELGRDGDVISELYALTAEYPMHEKLSESLITALHNHGRPADALRAYNNIRSAMLDQLGMEPGTALQKLQRTVLCREGIRGRALGNRNAPVS